MIEDIWLLWKGIRIFRLKLREFFIFMVRIKRLSGKHANFNSEFVLINVAGTSKVKVDDGINQKIFRLDRPHIGIYLPKMVWKDMYDFSHDSVLLVLASEHYDENEYIRSYSKYLEIVRKKFEEETLC